MRKKWLGQLYEVIAFDKDLSGLPEGLKGWRNDWVMNTLIPVIKKHKIELQQVWGSMFDKPQDSIIDKR
ncbi:hypothetical protein [Psychrobacter sp. WY6]|uniref:hypothetical protein n=1 Tax=Psychrobacter sp. WY6 TaxID=2708350 RepID=UPI002022DE86|nr:hypothetical protein [Psychrobacter sp. WY6]